MKRRLRNLNDPHGRLDVLLYRLAERWMQNLERERGVIGLEEHLLPLFERVIAGYVPEENLIPPELRELSKLVAKNAGRKLC